MTQAICDITTDEVNVDVVVEPQADTMVEVANRAGGMEQVFHDNTLIGNGNSIDLGVNTDLIATKEYVDEKVESIDTYTKDQIDGKLTAVDAQIDANADAIQKTREDFINADSEIHQILNNHAENLTTLHNDVDDLGDQVSEIESKIPESASVSNQLATKADLANIDLDDYVKKSGDTMTGDLVVSSDKFNTKAKLTTQEATGRTTLRVSAVDNENISTSFEFGYAGHLVVRRAGYDGGYIGSKDVPIKFVYAKYLNSADGDAPLGDRERDLIIPSVGGTLARIEDLIDLRADINEADSELQTQLNAQAAEIATKQDQLVAGDNIVISNNVISATGAGGGAGFDIVVVQELPATGQKGIIYLLAKDGAAPDVYDEYVWIESTQTFELIGTTQVDLTEYVKNTDYATSAKAGVVKANSYFGLFMSGDSPYPATRTLEQYNSASTLFVGKGTLENIKDDYVKRGITANTIALTDEEKTSARTWLGAVGNTDYATKNTYGVVKVDPTGAHGVGMNDSAGLYIAGATESQIAAKTNGNRAITPRNLDLAVKVGVTTNTIELTDDEKAAAQAWLGVSGGGDIDISHINNESVVTKDLTVGTDEGTINIGIVAGTATIATNNGLDIVAQTKFDTAPTTDDNTTYANALDTSLVRKAQVATAIADAMANVDALPDQTGNAGKFLQTNGATASWAEVPAGGTKVIIKRYS